MCLNLCAGRIWVVIHFYTAHRFNQMEIVALHWWYHWMRAQFQFMLRLFLTYPLLSETFNCKAHIFIPLPRNVLANERKRYTCNVLTHRIVINFTRFFVGTYFVLNIISTLYVNKTKIAALDFDWSTLIKPYVASINFANLPPLRQNNKQPMLPILLAL